MDLQNSTASPNPKTLASQAQGILRNEILSGHLLPGERLRTKDLQARYGVGLSPLRESLQRLSTEGLVVLDEQRGFAVAPISLSELKDVTVARVALESAMLPLAIELGDADWEGDVVAAFHRLSRTHLPTGADDDKSEWESRHRAFHNALLSACGSAWLLRIHGQLVDQTERYRKIRMKHYAKSTSGARDVNAEHQVLMDAVLQRDTDRAVALMREHLEATYLATASWMQTLPTMELTP
jgi:DNA-binding GntR family transcriptional regulator